jgi:hypothetical protein
MIKDIEEYAENLTDWEMEFLDNARAYSKMASGLTDKQLEKLEQIWRKVTGVD